MPRPYPPPPSRFRQIGFMSFLIIVLTYLVFQEFGHIGIRVLLISLGIGFILFVAGLVYYLGARMAERHMSMGASLVTRHDAVDAVGDMLKLRAAGKSVPSIPKEVQPLKVIESIDSGQKILPTISNEFEIVPFQLPEKLQ